MFVSRAIIKLQADHALIVAAAEEYYDNVLIKVGVHPL
jgi:hypothetical protein